MKCPLKVRDIHKIEKRIPLVIVFLVWNKEKHPIPASKKCFEVKNVDLLLIEEK